MSFIDSGHQYQENGQYVSKWEIEQEHFNQRPILLLVEIVYKKHL